jgi:cytochrome c oxidase assembly protein subunit 15
MTNSRQVIEEKVIARYKKWASWTLVTLFTLILIGGIVRATGAGMGCPDWPRCFGSWVPPTDVSQLPDNYKEIYGAKLKGEVEFNPVKTWIEYVNRLFGVFTGGWIFLTLIASIPFLKSDRKSIFYLSLSAFLLVGFQGWLGSKVVSTELHPGMVTLHMLLAIVIVFVLLLSFAKVSIIDQVKIETFKNGTWLLNAWVLIAIAISMAQVLLGTQVREDIDLAIVSLGYSGRSSWVESAGISYLVHRSFSVLVLISVLGLSYLTKKNAIGSGVIGRLVKAMVGVLIAEILTGIILGYFSVPALLQPIHLTLAVLLVSIQFVIYLFLNADRIFKKWSAEGSARV